MDGEPVPPWTGFDLEPGRRLRIGAAPDALRGYLAAGGGFALPPRLGSLSTHVRSGLGGLDGGVLRPGTACRWLPAQRPPGRR